MDTFTGIPRSALEFYADLETNNNQDWWLAHKDQYDVDVRRPLLALLLELEPRFGSGTLFRPYRDMRFSPKNIPYKSSQRAFVSPYEEVGFYLHIDKNGLRLGAGCRLFTPAQLSRYRSAVDSSVAGTALAVILDAAAESGYVMDGQALKGTPRGFPADHPHADLLRHKTLGVSQDLGTPRWLGTAEGADEIARRWELLRPLVEWIVRYAAP